MRLITLLLILVSPLGIAAPLERADHLQQLVNEYPGRVILLLISQPDCSYCEQIKADILQPMLISGDYDNSTLIRELEINTGQIVTDFNGDQVDATAFAKRYNAWATPTLLFLDNHGREVADKMIGYNTPDMYGYYVDRSLRQGSRLIAGN